MPKEGPFPGNSRNGRIDQIDRSIAPLHVPKPGPRGLGFEHEPIAARHGREPAARQRRPGGKSERLTLIEGNAVSGARFAGVAATSSPNGRMSCSAVLPAISNNVLLCCGNQFSRAQGPLAACVCRNGFAWPLINRKDHGETHTNALECDLCHIRLTHLEAVPPEDWVEVFMRHHSERCARHPLPGQHPSAVRGSRQTRRPW